MRRHGFLAAILLGTAATTGWVLSRPDGLDASEENGRSFREALTRTAAETEPVEDPEGVRLNFFDATWERVLKNVADQQQLTLVMDEIPPGHYARRDKKFYDIDSAVRILNAELESQGYRLLRQNEFLIVLNLDKARTEYSRPRLGSSSALASSDGRPGVRPTATTPTRSIPLRTNTHSHFRDPATGLRGIAQTADNDTGESDETTSPSSRSRFGTPVSQVSYMTQTEGATQTEAAARNLETPLPVVTQTVECRNTKASELARTIYLVFEKRAKLELEGINGLPSFTVFEPAKDGQSTPTNTAVFRIGIDQNLNQLIIEAPQNKQPHLKSLIAELDKPADLSNSTVKLLPNNGLGTNTAKDLNEQIHQLVSMNAAAAAAGSGARPNPFAQETPAAGQPPAGTSGAAGQTIPPGGQEPQGETLNLRGEVNVQAMQDLGILILKGNEADIGKVAEIIARLETMSVGSLPDIHILTLKNLNSEAMAELMTSVYEELNTLRQRGTTTRKTAAFIPVVQPNAILILASQLEMESILKLANDLDQPLDPDFEFQVYPLKNAIASQVVTALDSFYSEPTGLRTRPRAVADVRTNSVIVQGRINDLTEVGKLIERIDKDESGAVHRVRIFGLKNASATELSTTISSAIQAVTNPPQQTTGGQGGFGGLGGLGGTTGSQELRASKSVALEFLSTDGNAQHLIKSGILVDVRVNADVRSNSLIVSAPEASMNLMGALIQALDMEPTAIAEIKVFTLRNADAEQSVTLLQAMFDNQNTTDQVGIQIAGTQGSASSLIPIRFSADIRTNTVLAIGSAEAVGVAEAILLRLDTADVRQRQTDVIQLRNAPAELVAETITRYLEQQATLQDSSADLVSNIERLRQEVIVAEDVNSNSLIVSASPQYFDQIRSIIDALDATPPEVVIQALIVEVTLDATDEFGIELGFQDPLQLTRSLTSETVTTAAGTVTNVTGVGSPGLNFNNTTTGLGTNALTGPRGTVGTQGLSNFSLGRQNTDLGFGGFVFSAQSDAVSVLLRALSARRTVHVLSRPQIRTVHNSLASVTVGQNVPLVNGATVNQLGTASPQIVREATGITLEVTPRITPDGIIAMDVYANKSALAGTGVPIYVNPDGSTIDSPIINQSVADTVVNVPNGQTIVIGGMITKIDSTLERKVPWLGDLPYVGKAFRYDGTTTNRTELLIFLTPRIILNDLDSELMKQIESERTHFIESEAEAIHGPLYSVPLSAQQLEDPYGPVGNEIYPPTAPVQGDPEEMEAPAADNSEEPLPELPTAERQQSSARSTRRPVIQPVSGVQDRKGPTVIPSTKSTVKRTER